MSISEIQKKPTYTEEIVNWFRDSIISGVFEPGERLIETAIAEKLGVSRVPVREAMKVLASEGVIVDSPIRGYEVWTPTLESLYEIVDLRYMLEVMAYDFLPEKFSKSLYASFSQKVKLMKEAFQEESYQAASHHDRVFHEGLVKLSGLPRVYSFWTQIMTQWEVIANMGTKKKITFTEDQFGGIHQEILDALFNKDVEHATERLKFHVDYSKENVKTIMTNMERTIE